MSNVTKKAQKIFERRQELDVKKNQIEQYVEKVLDVFEASNFEESKLLVWQLYLYANKNQLECKIAFAEDETDITNFLYKTSLQLHTPRMLLLHSMQVLDSLNIPTEMLSQIHDYFRNTLSKYFIVYELSGKTIIKLKKETNCEN